MIKIKEHTITGLYILALIGMFILICLMKFVDWWWDNF